MKNYVLALLSIVILCSVMPACAEKAAESGAKLGEWTQDYDAAIKLAKDKKVPVFLDFSGSDWCGWCKLMSKNVFSKDEWKKYAKENLVLVLIDFPKDSSLVPEKFRDRNEELKQKYGVRGFPTFIILDCDGETQVGQLGASRDATPESFIKELSSKLKYCAGQVEKYTKSLQGKDKKEYQAIISKLEDTKKDIAEAKETIAEAKKEIGELQKQQEEIEWQAAEFRAKQKGAEALKEYKELKGKYDEAVKELEDWFESGPEQSKENFEKMQEMKKKISELADKLVAF